MLPNGSFVGFQCILTGVQMAAIAKNGVYFNVHTTANPGGKASSATMGLHTSLHARVYLAGCGQCAVLRYLQLVAVTCGVCDYVSPFSLKLLLGLMDAAPTALCCRGDSWPNHIRQHVPRPRLKVQVR